LHILVVEIKLAEAVIGAVAGVVIGEDGLEGFLFRTRSGGGTKIKIDCGAGALTYFLVI
jgi:hypothetical protein